MYDVIGLVSLLPSSVMGTGHPRGVVCAQRHHREQWDMHPVLPDVAPSQEWHAAVIVAATASTDRISSEGMARRRQELLLRIRPL